MYSEDIGGYLIKLKNLKDKEIKEIISNIDQGLINFIKEGKYKEVLISMGNLNNYSINNQLYIISQKQDAKTLYTLKKWNSYGRQVNSGEKAIKLFRPIINKIKDDENKISKEDVKGYQIGYLFDISQTKGKELDVFKFDESKVIENKDIIIDNLKRTISKFGYDLSFVNKEELVQDCYGLCNHKNKKILVLKELCDLQKISTCIHECAHVLAHSNYRSDFKGLTRLEIKEIKEIEAESIACIVSSYLGLDTKNFNFSYILGWAEGDILKFRKNLDVISKYSNILINGIEEKIC